LVERGEVLTREKKKKRGAKLPGFTARGRRAMFFLVPSGKGRRGLAKGGGKKGEE